MVALVRLAILLLGNRYFMILLTAAFIAGYFALYGQQRGLSQAAAAFSHAGQCLNTTAAQRAAGCTVESGVVTAISAMCEHDDQNNCNDFKASVSLGSGMRDVVVGDAIGQKIKDTPNNVVLTLNVHEWQGMVTQVDMGSMTYVTSDNPLSQSDGNASETTACLVFGAIAGVWTVILFLKAQPRELQPAPIGEFRSM